jgi:WD40 repeat protein
MSVVIVTTPEIIDEGDVLGEPGELLPGQNTVRVLDSEFRELLEFPVMMYIRGVLVSPTVDYIAVLGQHSVRLYSFQTGTMIFDRLIGAESFDVSPDGLTIALASYSGKISLMDTSTGQIRETFTIQRQYSRIKYYGYSLLAMMNNDYYNPNAVNNLLEYTPDGIRRLIAPHVYSYSISNGRDSIAVMSRTGIDIMRGNLTSSSAHSAIQGQMCLFSSDDSTVIIIVSRSIRLFSSLNLNQLKMFRVRDSIQNAFSYGDRLILNTFRDLIVVDPETKHEDAYEYGERVSGVAVVPLNILM